MILQPAPHRSFAPDFCADFPRAAEIWKDFQQSTHKMKAFPDTKPEACYEKSEKPALLLVIFM
jgi:hypothetical protein